MAHISIQDIEILFKLIITKLKNDNINDIEININEYWLVLTSHWDDFQKEPTLSVGSLQDDLSYLKETIKNNQIFTYSDLDRVAAILRFVSEQQAPSSAN